MPGRVESVKYGDYDGGEGEYIKPCTGEIRTGTIWWD
jgi:hypothetical protein